MPEVDKNLSKHNPISRFFDLLIKIITDSKHYKSEHFKFGTQALTLLVLCLAIPIFNNNIFIQYFNYFVVIVTFMFVIILVTFYYQDKSINRKDSQEIEDKMNKISRR